MKAINLPRSPSSARVISFAGARENFKAKFVPRPPKDDESMLLIQRPQIGPYDFLEYARGDLITSSSLPVVVTAAKAGFTRSGEGWKRWEQLLVVRPANDADHAAVAAQRAEQAAESERVMARMMSS